MISMDCEHYFVVNGTPKCYGTKEREMCCCDGDERKCDFYPEKRELAALKETTIYPNEIADEYIHLRDGKITVNEMRESLGLAPLEELGPRILDSGNRREFESGAVRDIQEGKGRCDLLPLDVVAAYIEPMNDATDWVLHHISQFQEYGAEHYLFSALNTFQDMRVEWDIHTLILEVAKHFEEGAKKYGDNNWQKGIPVHCYIDSGVRHYLKFLRGDKDERHDRAFVWNLMCAIWTCKHKPELNEYATK